MNHEFNVNQYWRDVLEQNERALPSYFEADAWIRWHNTNEQFTAEEFIQANCVYPGNWAGEMEKCIWLEDTVITVVHVFDRDSGQSFHVTSFIRLRGGRIAEIDEYWGDDGPVPTWRQELNIGREIQ